jgi:peptidoglycan hydrolase CwlO-like protein
MKRIFFIVPILGMVLSCSGRTKQAEQTNEEFQKQIEAIELSIEQMDESINSLELEIEKSQSEIDSLLNEI